MSAPPARDADDLERAHLIDRGGDVTDSIAARMTSRIILRCSWIGRFAISGSMS
jgi:hypothetical protein